MNKLTLNKVVLNLSMYDKIFAALVKGLVLFNLLLLFEYRNSKKRILICSWYT